MEVIIDIYLLARLVLEGLEDSVAGLARLGGEASRTGSRLVSLLFSGSNRVRFELPRSSIPDSGDGPRLLLAALLPLVVLALSAGGTGSPRVHLPPTRSSVRTALSPPPSRRLLSETCRSPTLEEEGAV